MLKEKGIRMTRTSEISEGSHISNLEKFGNTAQTACFRSSSKVFRHFFQDFFSF